MLQVGHCKHGESDTNVIGPGAWWEILLNFWGGDLWWLAGWLGMVWWLIFWMPKHDLASLGPAYVLKGSLGILWHTGGAPQGQSPRQNNLKSSTCNLFITWTPPYVSNGLNLDRGYHVTAYWGVIAVLRTMCELTLRSHVNGGGHRKWSWSAVIGPVVSQALIQNQCPAGNRVVFHHLNL